MKIGPILFSTSNVQAILENRKGMTQRVIKPQTVTHSTGNGLTVESLDEFMRRNQEDAELLCAACATYQPGDILWVREPWCKLIPPHITQRQKYVYKADCTALSETLRRDYINAGFPYKWRSPATMPREAARLFLRVTDVRVERVREITAEDCIAEGIEIEFPQPKPPYLSPAYAEKVLKPAFIGAYRVLWDSLNAKRGHGWDTNPWVWVYSFEPVDKPVGWPSMEPAP